METHREILAKLVIFNMRVMIWISPWNISRAAMSSRFSRLRRKPSPVRIELFGDTVDAIHEIDPLTGKSLGKVAEDRHLSNTHYLIAPDRYERAITGIEEELEARVAAFRKNGQLLEAQRIEQRNQIRSRNDSCHGGIATGSKTIRAI